MRAAIYTRVSQDRTNTARSVTEQETECRAVAERNDWTITEVFTDNDKSASRYATKARPGFEALRDHITGGHCDILITWEASRSTRDLATYVTLRDLCRQQGVAWNYSGRTYDLTDASDQFGTGLDALLAEQESARSSARVRRSVRANATAGRPHGRNLYGYRRVYDTTTRALIRVEIDETEAAVLREYAARIIQGDSIRAISADLERRGVPSPSGATRWYPVTITRSLKNPNYMSKRTHNGAVVGEAIWPALFDETTWVRLQAILNDPARRTERDSSVLKHLLSGIALCGLCGARMALLPSRGVWRYTCSEKYHVARVQAPTDDYVTGTLLEVLGDPGRHQLLRPAQTDEISVAAHLAAAEKRARLDTFYDAAAAGELTPAALARIEQRMLAEIAQHDTDARRATIPPALRQLAGTDIVARWDTLPMRTKRAMLRYYLDIRVMPVGSGKRKFDAKAIVIKWKA